MGYGRNDELDGGDEGGGGLGDWSIRTVGNMTMLDPLVLFDYQERRTANDSYILKIQIRARIT